jgi:hypothetical protein
VKVRNEGGAATYNAVKSGKWSWIEVPGKKSTDKAYRVLHGFIESKYIVVKKTAPPPAPVADKKTDQPADGQPPEASNVPDTGKVHAKLKLLNQKRLGGTRVDAAIELARHAIIAATDTPPDSEVALMRLKQVEDFLRPLIEEKNVRKYFSGAVTGTQAGIIVAQSVSAVHSLQTYIRLGLNASEDGRNGGLWDYYFAQLKLGREHMVVLSGDLPMTISMWPLDQKLQASLKASTKYFEGEWGDRFNELISPTSLGIMAGMTGLWAISQATPVGWIADGIALFLISVTIFFVGKEAKEIAELLVQFFSLTLNAKSQSDFDLAGKAFAAAVTKASIDIIMAILFHKGGKALGPKIPGMVQALKMKGGKFTFGLEPIGEAAGGPGGVRMPIPEKGPATMMSESAPGTGAAPQPATGAGPGATPQPAAGGAPTPGINPAASAGATAAFANMLVLAKWLGKKMNVGDLPLPEGYNWKNKKISRNPGKKEANYAPLELRDGILQIGEGGERISNPSVMNRNYVASLTQAIKAKFPQLSELQAKAEAVAQAAKESIHHLIPDNVVQSHPLMKLAKELFGYDLDRGSNLKGLPKSKALTGAGETGHWTSHPKYDAIVWEKLETLKTKLDAEFKSFDKTPKQRLLDEIFKIESELRKLIEDGKAPMKDGHLAENEPVTPEGDGGSEYA